MKESTSYRFSANVRGKPSRKETMVYRAFLYMVQRLGGIHARWIPEKGKKWKFTGSGWTKTLGDASVKWYGDFENSSAWLIWSSEVSTVIQNQSTPSPHSHIRVQR
jgi:hypothetical protein